jgi:hypothetical protein
MVYPRTDVRQGWRLHPRLVLTSALVAAAVLSSPPSARAQGPANPGGEGVSVVVLPGKAYTSPPALDQAEPPGSRFAWRQLCVAESAGCSLILDPRGVYRIRGGQTEQTSADTDADGNATGTYSTSTWAMLDSSPFHIAEMPRSQVLHVHGAGSNFRVLGWIFTPSSLAFLVPAGLAFGGVFTKDETFRLAFGIPFAASGAAFLGIGAWVLTKRTKVVDDSGRVLARPAVKLGDGLELGPTGLAF